MTATPGAWPRANPGAAPTAPSPPHAGAERRGARFVLSESPHAAPPGLPDVPTRIIRPASYPRPGAARRLQSWFNADLPAPLCPGLCGFWAWAALFAVACFWSLCLPGCATESDAPPPTVSTWQRNLEQYVWDRGNGDPNVLADASWDDVHKGFAVIGDPLPDRSTDEIGLLLAHRMIDGKPWFLFLLGTVVGERLEDLRPVGLNIDNGTFHWSIGSSDDHSLSLYRAWSADDRSRAQPPDPHAPPFPRPDETFDVRVRDGTFIVRHEESGASWELRPSLRANPATRPTAIPQFAPANPRTDHP